jgi:tRNA(Arg) A34 adenosine deaminase TadA
MNDVDYLKLAVEQAELSVKKGGFPAGCVIVRDGKILAKGISVGYSSYDPTGHGESLAIRSACQSLQATQLTGATVYDSMEPCLMCFSAAYWSGIEKIVYACRKTNEMVKKHYYEGESNIESINNTNSRNIELVYLPDFEARVLAIIEAWEKQFV